MSQMMTDTSATPSLIREQRGVAGLEAAIVIPIVLFFMLAMVEMYQYFRVIAVVDRAAFTVANSLAVQNSLTLDHIECDEYDPGKLCTYAEMMPGLMTPLEYTNRAGKLEIGFFTHEAGNQADWTLDWSVDCPANASCSQTDNYDLSGQAPSPPLDSNDYLLAVTSQTEYTPFSLSSELWRLVKPEPMTLSSTVYFRPRHNGLITLHEIEAP